MVFKIVIHPLLNRDHPPQPSDHASAPHQHKSAHPHMHLLKLAHSLHSVRLLTNRPVDAVWHLEK